MVLDPELFEHDVGSRVVSRFSEGAQLPLDVRIGSMPGAANTLPALERRQKSLDVGSENGTTPRPVRSHVPLPLYGYLRDSA